MKINETYVYINDKNPSPQLLQLAFRVLQKVVEDNINTLNKAPNVPELNLEQIEEVKEKYYKMLKETALKLAKAFGSKKNGVYVYKYDYFGTRIEMKASGKAVKYLKINGNYIISNYGEPGLPEIVYALKVINDAINYHQKELQEVQK